MSHLDETQRRKGNLDAIMDGFISKSPLYKMQSICGAVNHRVYNDAIRKQLDSLKSDGTTVMGYSLSQLAIAALDRFGAIQYAGNDPSVIALIKAEKWFDQ